MVTEAFCVRCRKNVEIQEEETVQYRNKRWAKKGLCPECGGKVFRTISGKKGFLERLIPLPEQSKGKDKETKGVPGPE